MRAEMSMEGMGEREANTYKKVNRATWELEHSSTSFRNFSNSGKASKLNVAALSNTTINSMSGTNLRARAAAGMISCGGVREAIGDQNLL